MTIHIPFVRFYKAAFVFGLFVWFHSVFFSCTFCWSPEAAFIQPFHPEITSRKVKIVFCHSAKESINLSGHSFLLWIFQSVCTDCFAVVIFRLAWVWWHSLSTVAFWQSLSTPRIICQVIPTPHRILPSPPLKAKGIRTKPNLSLNLQLTVLQLKTLMVITLRLHHTESVENLVLIVFLVHDLPVNYKTVLCP